MDNADAQRLMDLEDVQVRHERLLKLLQEQSELASQVCKLQAELAAAKRRLRRVTDQIRDESIVERSRKQLK